MNDEFHQFAEEFAKISNIPSIDLKISPLAAWCLITQIQLAARHPQNTGIMSEHARDIANSLVSRLSLSKTLSNVIEKGWHKEYDVDAHESNQEYASRIPQREIIEVHNAYALYESDDGQAMMTTSRPQDWADKTGWAYERFKFEWLCTETQASLPESDEMSNVAHYINNAHCWYSPQVLQKHEVPKIFAGAIATILMPGGKEQLCGNRFLSEEDFWCDEWGDMPPIYWDEDGDYFDDTEAI
jgi:hypothetical protein